MKLSFVLSVLASMAVLSLAVPLVASDGEEAMLQALSATLEAQGGNAASADAESTVDVETEVTSSRLVRSITITSPRPNWMSFSWVACYDSAGARCFASWRCKFVCNVLKYGLLMRSAFRKQCVRRQARICIDLLLSSQVSPHTRAPLFIGFINSFSAWGTATTPLTATQGFGTHAGNCFHSGTPASGNWWKVDLQGDFDIRSIKFGSRNDGNQDQSSGLVITMQDKVTARC